MRLSHRPDAGLLQLEAPPGAQHPCFVLEIGTSRPLCRHYSHNPPQRAHWTVMCLLDGSSGWL